MASRKTSTAVEQVEGEGIYEKALLLDEIDITSSANHYSLEKNPGPIGEPNSSVDIVNENGIVMTRRWYDNNGRCE